MNTKQMIKENNRLQDAMKPINLSYYQDMVVYIRSSSVQEQKARSCCSKSPSTCWTRKPKAKAPRRYSEAIPNPIARSWSSSCQNERPQQPPIPSHDPVGGLNLVFFVQALVGFITMWAGVRSSA